MRHCWRWHFQYSWYTKLILDAIIVQVWLRNIQNLLKRGMEDAVRKVFDQSLLSLPKRKHLKVISQVAIMEFKTGSPERGRTIFEGVVRNYPRKTDLWSVYLDQVSTSYLEI
jgi:rRNA biogenesis protein RRP5